MQNLIYATLGIPGKSELDILLLAESLRSFGGELASNPLWVLVPAQLGSLSDATLKKLSQSDIRVISLDIDPEFFKFPFAAKIAAAAAVEAQALGQTERLVYLDRDTIVLQEPAEFLIPPGISLGYRPVHHQLIGSAWGSALDAFWSLIYQVCAVPQENLFPMHTHTGELIRPYFNAGVYIIRPEKGLLRQWLEIFLRWYRQPQFKAFYQQYQLYAIFVHQAIFTGVLLHHLKPGELMELSPRINYPLHLHDDIPLSQRPATIDQLVTVRYEDIFDRPGWEAQFLISQPLRNWLFAQPRLQASQKTG
jgi:hypothetical protein